MGGTLGWTWILVMKLVQEGTAVFIAGNKYLAEWLQARR